MEPMNDHDLRVALAVIDERINGMRTEAEVRNQLAATALVIASAEINRRLDLLNNENGRVKEAQNRSVDREVYAVEHKALAEKIAWMEKFVWTATGGIALIVFSAEIVLMLLK